MNQPDPIFVDEALANLDAMAQSLMAGRAHGPDRAQIDAMFRHAHSVKGGAAAFGLGHLADLMHQAESLLALWREGRIQPDAQGVALLLESVELARDGLTGTSTDPSVTSPLVARLRAAANVQAPAQQVRNRCIRIAGAGRPDLDDVVNALFRDIAGLGTVLATPGEGVSPGVFEVQTSASDAELVDLLAMYVDRAAIAIQDVLPPPVAPVPSPPVVSAGTAMPSVRVSLDELAQFDQLVGELSRVTAQLAIGQEGAEPAPVTEEVGRHVAHLQEITRQLRHALQHMQSAPVSDLFALVPALLVNLTHTLGKPFALALAGESVRLERSVIQALADPVVQLVRNACDHGIESAQDRRAAGKPIQGRIALAAEAGEGVVVLTVRDDGRGFSRSKLLQAAHAGGIDVDAGMPDQALWQLVFSPGLTTADSVTSVSGRGVGMDVVRRKITALGGTVEIESVAGAGTCVVIRLPAPARGVPRS